MPQPTDALSREAAMIRDLNPLALDLRELAADLMAVDRHELGERELQSLQDRAGAAATRLLRIVAAAEIAETQAAMRAAL